MATTCRWFSHQKRPFMADVPRLMTPKGRGKLPPATSALNCSSMSMAFGRPGLWGRSAQDAPRCAKYIHSQKSIDGSGICAMILLHIHVILRLERISKVIPSHWILVLVTSTFYVLRFIASLFSPLAGLCQLWPRRPHNRFRFLTARYAAPFSWKRARTILGKSPFPSCSSGTRGSPFNRPTDFHWFPMCHGLTCHNMICGIYLKNHLSRLFPYLGGSSWKSKICRDLCVFLSLKKWENSPAFLQQLNRPKSH